MEIQLEDLEYQRQAINSVVSLFRGQERNTFDNACHEGIRFNHLSLSRSEIERNLRNILIQNGIGWSGDKTAHSSEESSEENDLCIEEENDLCIEMETGTGKTLVYIKTIFELYSHYGFTKFIILVPSVAIREGLLATLRSFERQLENIYNIKPNWFAYRRERLSQVANFVEEQHPQIMVMTLQSFNSDDRILNQARREDLYSNMPYIEAIAHTRPLVIMDEPQEGMDTENSVERLKAIRPLFKLRYSATHRVLRNLVYRLSPYESYKRGLVKKIELLTVSDKNDESSMKIELARIELGRGDPKAILKAWHRGKSGFQFKLTKKLTAGSLLSEITGNIIYRDYEIEKIARPLREKGYVKFKNGAIIYEGDQAKDYSSIFSEQLYWLIDTHFRKREKLKKRGVKCLSLIFIDRVDHYMQPDGIIKRAFIEQYRKIYQEFYQREPSPEQVEGRQGFYFAKTGKGEFTDNERSMAANRELFDLILKNRERLLRLDNPVEFIFSHSALGVGWDNPNVFNIAALNQSYSEIKKRQEIGRGLRICVDQEGRRLYDSPAAAEGEELNLLTIIPNETYKTFVSQYQSEVSEAYGSAQAGAEIRHRHKSKEVTKKTICRNEAHFNTPAFREFWRRLSQKTEYLVAFEEEQLVERAIEALNTIAVPEPQIEVSLGRIEAISNRGVVTRDFREESRRASVAFSPVDLVEEIEKNSQLARTAAFRIVQGIQSKREFIKNPYLFLHEAIRRINDIELDEMLRALSYSSAGQSFDLRHFEKYIVTHTANLQPTPERGVYDSIIWDSQQEQKFAAEADGAPSVVCFLKLPSFYVIKTPVGDYNPDFGLVLKKRRIREEQASDCYFVVEIKGTNNMDDRKALTKNEVYKMKCALRHFEALGIEATVNHTVNHAVSYIAPVKEFESFKQRVDASRREESDDV